MWREFFFLGGGEGGISIYGVLAYYTVCHDMHTCRHMYIRRYNCDHIQDLRQPVWYLFAARCEEHEYCTLHLKLNFWLTFVLLSLYQVTALHMAVDRACIDTVKYLVSKGADIDIQDDNGVMYVWQPLQI